MAPHYAWHKIREDGLTFYVWGYKLANGNIRWDQRLAENIEQYQKAVAARDSQPKARNVPWKPEYDRPNVVQASNPVSTGQTLPASLAEPNNFGIPPEKLFKAPPGQERIETNASAAQMNEFLGFQSPLPRSDGGGELAKPATLYLTLVGPESQTKPIAEEWKAKSDFAPYRDEVVFNTYTPSVWQGKRAIGNGTPGKPLVLIHNAEGRLLYRGLDYSGGATKLAREIARCHPKFSQRPWYERMWTNMVINAFEMKYGDVISAWAGVVAAILVCAYVIRRKRP